MMSRGLSYDAAHAAAIEKYGVSPFGLYHPEVISKFPEAFNNAWRAFWGIK
jgi:filamentous hemagglutinin